MPRFHFSVSNNSGQTTTSENNTQLVNIKGKQYLNKGDLVVNYIGNNFIKMATKPSDNQWYLIPFYLYISS